MSKKISTNTLSDEDHDKLFCLNGKKYGIKKLLLKAVAGVESSFDERAYRFEPGFWAKYMKDKPEWKGRDPAIVSASYGLCQLMWSTAWTLGFRGTQEDLWNPVINIELAAKLLSVLRGKVKKAGVLDKFPALFEWDVVLCLYNGGTTGNPSEDGKLRNQKYADRVMTTFYDLKKKERECDDADIG
jgi:soluble lytic murein transglycosylase-like protein